VRSQLNERFNEIGFNDWALGIYPHQYFVGLSDIPEGGVAIHILAMIYFLVMDSPIFFDPPLIEIIRENFCYWLIHGELPL
jgi:hypothetical protein